MYIIMKSHMVCWQDRHYRIVQESAEKFKTHTKDQEVDI